MGTYSSSRFRGTHLSANHIKETPAGRLAGLIGDDLDCFVGVKLEAGAEAANVISVSLDFVDANLDPISDRECLLQCELFDNNGLEALSTNFTISAGDNALAYSTDAKARVFMGVQNGSGTIDIEDVGAVGAATIWLRVTPVANTQGTPTLSAPSVIALTFAA